MVEEKWNALGEYTNGVSVMFWCFISAIRRWAFIILFFILFCTSEILHDTFFKRLHQRLSPGFVDITHHWSTWDTSLLGHSCVDTQLYKSDSLFLQKVWFWKTYFTLNILAYFLLPKFFRSITDDME